MSPIAETSFTSNLNVDGSLVPVTVFAELWPALRSTPHVAPDEPEIQVIGVEYEGSCVAGFITDEELGRFEDEARVRLIDEPAAYFSRLMDGADFYAEEVRA